MNDYLFCAKIKDPDGKTRFTRFCTLQELLDAALAALPFEDVYTSLENELGYQLVKVGALTLSLSTPTQQVKQATPAPPLNPPSLPAPEPEVDDEEEEVEEDFAAKAPSKPVVESEGPVAYSYTHPKGPYTAEAPSASKRKSPNKPPAGRKKAAAKPLKATL